MYAISFAGSFYSLGFLLWTGQRNGKGKKAFIVEKYTMSIGHTHLRQSKVAVEDLGPTLEASSPAKAMRSKYSTPEHPSGNGSNFKHMEESHLKYK